MTRRNAAISLALWIVVSQACLWMGWGWLMLASCVLLLPFLAWVGQAMDGRKEPATEPETSPDGYGDTVGGYAEWRK